MSLSEKLKALEPDRGNPVEQALSKLSEKDRQAWIEALNSGLWFQETLAKHLSDEVGTEITRSQVREWKRR